MELTDFMLSAKVNLALARDPRVTSLDISVQAENGTVFLRGDVDTDDESRIAEQIAAGVPGVRRICNDLSVGAGAWAGKEDLLKEMLLQKLETEWAQIPQRNSLIECDYMRWALWLVHKFHIPAEVGNGDRCRLEDDAKDRALNQLSKQLGVPSVMLAWAMREQAEKYSDQQQSDAPIISHLPLAPSPARTAA